MMKLELHPLLPLLYDAEDLAWRSSDVPVAEASVQHDDDSTKDTVGSQILRHGKTVTKIHAYFMDFEARRCCMKLAAGKTTFTNIRVIPVAREDCEEMGSRPPSPHQSDTLSHKDFYLYCETVQCAKFPILGALPPPPETTPPNSPASNLMTPPVTPKHKDRSFVHEISDEFMASLVKEEQIHDLVRNVFGLSLERAAQYNNIIFSMYQRQKPPRILVDELVSQLSMLENNSNPFYHPDKFLSAYGYREWQQRERQQLMDKITKFWQEPLPKLTSGKTSLQPSKQNVHHHYCRLLLKLIRYGHGLVPASELNPSFLSADAQRLLKEYALRYGIGDQYRKLVYLEYVATHFLHEVWYVHHANAALCEILHTLPADPARLVMVIEEKNLLYKCCQCFLLECENSLRKVRQIFHGYSPAMGIGALIELLTNVLRTSSYLQNQPTKSIEELLVSWLESGFTTEYEQHKMMECYDLQLNASMSLLSPKLLYRIIIKIRDSLRSYRNEYQLIFNKYIDIEKMAAQSFYRLLMSDVKVMCEDAQVAHVKDGLSLQMVSFAYRLHQLDKDWAGYIQPQDQTWRKAFLPEVLHWSRVVRKDSMNLVLQCVAADKFQPLNIEEREILTEMVSEGTRSKPLSPSPHSAFTETFASSFSQYQEKVTRSDTTVMSTNQSCPDLQKNISKKNFASDEATNLADSARVVTSVPDISSKRQKKKKSLRAVYSTSAISEQISQSMTSISKSSSSPEIHALMQRMEDIQKIQDNAANKLALPPNRLLSDEENFNNNSHSTPNLSHSTHEFVFDGKSRNTDLQSTLNKFESKMDERTAASRDSNKNEDILSIESLVTTFPPLSEVDSHVTAKHLDQTDLDLQANMLREAAHSLLNIKPKKLGRGLKAQPSTLPQQSRKVSDIFRKIRAQMTEQGTSDLSATLQPQTLSLTSNLTSYQVISGQITVSSSVIDLLCLLNRIINFAAKICDIIYPLYVSTGQRLSAEKYEMKEQLTVARKLLCDKFIRTVSACIALYSQNMLAMDLCSTGKCVNLVNAKLLKDLHVAYEHGYTCYMYDVSDPSHPNHLSYQDANPRYLATKYKPINAQMCVRINNLREVGAMLDQVKEIFDKLMQVEVLTGELGTLNLIQGTCQVDESISRDMPACGSAEWNQVFWQCQRQLCDTSDALLNILTYRINMFSRDALSILMELQLPMVSIKGRLAPLVEFIMRHMDFLRKWLVKDTYIKAMLLIWKCIAEDFEEEERKLISQGEKAQYHAMVLLQTLAYLLRLISKKEPEIGIETLSTAVEKVSFRLEIHTLPTAKLCNLEKLLHHWQSSQMEMSVSSGNRYAALPVEFLHKLKTSMHGERKSFTGQELMTWLLNHPLPNFSSGTSASTDTHGNTTPYSELSQGNSALSDSKPLQNTLVQAQWLLDAGIVCPVMEDKRRPSKPENINQQQVGGKPYPNVVDLGMSIGSSNISVSRVHSVVSGRGYDGESESDEEDVHQPKLFKYASPPARDVLFHSLKEKPLEPVKESKPKMTTSFSTPNLSQNMALFKPELEDKNKQTNVQDSSIQTPETTSNSSNYIFQHSAKHYYRVHTLMDLISDLDPNENNIGESQDNTAQFYKDSGIDVDFVLKILKNCRRSEPKVKQHLQTITRRQT